MELLSKASYHLAYFFRKGKFITRVYCLLSLLFAGNSMLMLNLGYNLAYLRWRQMCTIDSDATRYPFP